MDVYDKLYSDGILDKENFISYLRELIYDNFYSEGTDLATNVLGAVIKNHIFEMIDDIQFLYDENRIDLYTMRCYKI